MPQNSSGSNNPADRLDSWKEIANYLKRGVRSVRLWEGREGLPVHRHHHHRRSSVYAFRSELDRWLENRRPRQLRSTAGQLILALVPVRDLGCDPRQDGFAEGLTEELATHLAFIDHARLGVVVCTSEDNRRVGCADTIQTLSPNFLLSGAVRGSGGQLRTTVRLTDARRQIQVWAQSYQHSNRDPLGIQVYIARCVASQVQVQLLSGERSLAPQPSSTAGAAHLAYLEGRVLLRERTIHALRKAIASFDHALRLEPSYAAAYSGLADSYALLGYYSGFSLLQAKLTATQAARKAIELDDQLSEAHASMGEIKAFYEWDWTGGDFEFQRAIALDPTCATTHHWYANLLSVLGRTREATAHGLKALQIEPCSPLIMAGVGLVHFYCNQPDITIGLCKKALQIDPNYALGLWALGMAYEQKGDHEEALRQFQRGVKHDRENLCLSTSMAHTYALAGDEQKARAILDKLIDSSMPRTASAYDLAVLYAGLNEPDNAFRWLQQACEERSDWVPYLGVEPRFRNLRADPRYLNLLDKVGLH